MNPARVGNHSSDLVADPKVPRDAVVYPAGDLTGWIQAQPSKNYTSRYLLAAALSDGESVVRHCATSDDARAMQRCLRGLGASIEPQSSADGTGEDVQVLGFAGRPRLTAADKQLDVGNAGAVLRLLLGTGALLPEVTFTTTHQHSLGKRPNADLLRALEQLGCSCSPPNGLLPITLRGGALKGGRIHVSGAKSSQFLSSLLFLAPVVGEQVAIEVVDGLVSRAPVRQTLEVLREVGIAVQASEELLHFSIQPQPFIAGERHINGDWPGSAAILAAAVVAGGDVTVKGLLQDEQGEREAFEVLKRMGAEITASDDEVVVKPSSMLCGVEFDGDLATDAVLALMGAAAFAEGRTRFYGVSNLRLKECDRISEPIAELRKLGVQCWEGSEVGDSDPDAIVIEGNPEGYAGGVEADGRGDHRVIMLLSIIGLRCKHPIRILGAHHVAKSYPSYFSHLSALGAEVELVEPKES